MPHFWLLLALILTLAAIVRFWNLSADPMPFNAVATWVDEGYWTHEARLETLGIPHRDDLVHSKAAGPLSYALFRASFALGGVSYTTARLPSALAGLLLVGVVAWFAFTVWGPRHALAAAFMMALADVAVIFSRLGLVEMPMTLFLSLALLLQIHPHQRSPLLAGFFAALAFLVKLTSLYYFPGLVTALCLSAPRKDWVPAMIRFGAGFVPVPLFWLTLAWLPHAEQYWAMVQAAAESCHRPLVGLTSLKLTAHAALFNHFLGQPSIALLVPVAVYVGTNRIVWQSNAVVRALLAWGGIFWVLFIFSGDLLAFRRCVPCVTPLVLVACWALLEHQPSRNWVRSAVVLMGALCVSRTAYRSSLAQAFGADAVGHWLAFGMLGLMLMGLVLLLCGRIEGVRARAWILRGWALVFALPALATLFQPTFTLRDTARHLAKKAGMDYVIGFLPHSLALEGTFYPVFYTPGRRGLEKLNKNFDFSKITYQVLVKRQHEDQSAEYKPGLGVTERVELLATYEVLPRVNGAPRHTLELYRWHQVPTGQNATH